ncbi:shikimate kinase [Candidatus Woesearchaeota archaeon]|nr:shikimate kinase [Candidatus Woesearchaeota archaeon]
MNLIIIGFKAAGKTTIGKMVAKKNDTHFIDTDDMIEEKGESCREIMEKHGEEHFKKKEKEVIMSLEADNTIIAVGGGALDSEENRMKLKKLGKMVYLKLSKDILLERLKKQGFPPYMDESSFPEIFEKRDKIFQMADDTIGCDNKTPEKISEEIQWETRLEKN